MPASILIRSARRSRIDLHAHAHRGLVVGHARAHRSSAPCRGCGRRNCPGVQRLPRPSVTVDRRSRRPSWRARTCSGCASASRYTKGLSSEPTGRCASTARLKPCSLETAAADDGDALRRCARRSPPGRPAAAGGCLFSTAFSVRVTAPSAYACAEGDIALSTRQARALQRVGGIVARELAAHEVDVGREAVGDVARRLRHAERRVLRAR